MNVYSIGDSKSFLAQSSSKGNQTKWVYSGKFLKADSMGYESISEVVSSELEAQIQGCNYVDYSLCKIIADGKMHSGCESDIFLKDGEEVYSFYRVLEAYYATVDAMNRDLKKFNGKDLLYRVVDVCSEVTNLGKSDILGYLSTVLKVDALILNEDRHLNNLGFIYDGVNFKLCPIYDNGLSLLSDTVDYPMPSTIYIRKVKAQPFSRDFEKQAGYITEIGPLKINYKDLKERLNSYTSDFKVKEFERAKSVLLGRLELLKGKIWEEV